MKITKLPKYIHYYEDLNVVRYVMSHLHRGNIEDLSVGDGINMLHTVLLTVSNREKTSQIVTRFMKHEVRRGRLTELEMQDMMISFGYMCEGCLTDQPNQLAHMGLGGCLYCEENEFWE